MALFDVKKLDPSSHSMDKDFSWKNKAPSVDIPSVINDAANMKEAIATSPSAVMTKAIKEEAPATIHTFPRTLTQASGAVDAGAYMKITCYEYARGYRELQDLESPETPKKKKYVINLPMPQTVSQEYSADTNQFQSGVVFDLFQNNLDETFGAGVSGAIGAGASVAIAALRSQASRFLTGATGGGFSPDVRNAVGGMYNKMSVAAGIAMNPRYEMAFNSMNIRTHSFDFNLIPTSSDDSETIRKLVHDLRLSAHPTISDKIVGLLYHYPDEFEISFYDHNHKRMTHIPNIPDCSIKDLGVSHATGRLHTDGTPISTRLTITFQEMVALHRDDIERLSS